MNKLYALTMAAVLSLGQAFAQDELSQVESNAEFLNSAVVMPASPLKGQILFREAKDNVETTPTYGNGATSTPAKSWHDFLGFTADGDSDDLGWISVNHERINIDNDFIGDGGGMTVFKVRWNADGDSLEVVEQTINNTVNGQAVTREGKYFNVDFVNTVGETGMNCGGIQGPDGRIWTAEEWFRRSNNSIFFPNSDPGDRGVRDTMPFTIQTNGDLPAFDGVTVDKYQNFNYMVEIDPRTGMAIRKQYNWGRQPFEGGAISNDNTTVYLGGDATPGFFSKFVADAPGDFTNGTLYIYKQDETGPNGPWVEIDNSNVAAMLNFDSAAVALGATMFNRIEWVTIDRESGAIYFTETGRDNPAGRWDDEKAAGADFAQHHYARAAAQGMELGQTIAPDSADYIDYYGRIVKYDPATNEMEAFIEGGPLFRNGASAADYPEIHLTNPDALTVMRLDGEQYLAIGEDLNGTSFGRMPSEVTGNRACEVFLYRIADADDQPDNEQRVNDLIRITTTPIGAEATGLCVIPNPEDPDTDLALLLNSQHASSSNPEPFDVDLTYAITGWDQVFATTSLRPEISQEEIFSVYPNPVARTLHFNEVTDVEILTLDGKRVRAARHVKSINVEGLSAGTYVIKNKEGFARKLIIQ